MFGLSVNSETITLVAGFKPSQPNAPVTSVVADSVVITWEAPNQNGSPITGYRITLKQQDSAFSEDLENCDGKQAASIVSSRECTIPFSVLTASPYDLTLGDSVYAKVSAINYYGESSVSDAGNGATVLYVPSAPVSLVNDLSTTSASVIRITWSDGISTGGSPIIDYRVSYDQSTGNYVTLAQGITV